MLRAECPLGGTVCVAYFAVLLGNSSHTLLTVERLCWAGQHVSMLAECKYPCTSVTGVCNSSQMWKEFVKSLASHLSAPSLFWMCLPSHFLCHQHPVSCPAGSAYHRDLWHVYYGRYDSAEAAGFSLFLPQEVLESRTAHSDIDIPWRLGQLVAIGVQHLFA